MSSPRDAFRADWRALASEAAACARDPHHDVAALRLLAKRGRKGWLWPSENREDNWVLTGLQGVADAYAHQSSVRRRGLMGAALASLAALATGILDASEPARAPPPASEPAKPYYLED